MARTEQQIRRRDTGGGDAPQRKKLRQMRKRAKTAAGAGDLPIITPAKKDLPKAISKASVSRRGTLVLPREVLSGSVLKFVGGGNDLVSTISLASCSSKLRRFIYRGKECRHLWKTIDFSKVGPERGENIDYGEVISLLRKAGRCSDGDATHKLNSMLVAKEKLTDVLLTALLNQVNAKKCTERIILSGCKQITGSGLDCLRGSRTLEFIDLRFSLDPFSSYHITVPEVSEIHSILKTLPNLVSGNMVDVTPLAGACELKHEQTSSLALFDLFRYEGNPEEKLVEHLKSICAKCGETAFGKKTIKCNFRDRPGRDIGCGKFYCGDCYEAAPKRSIRTCSRCEAVICSECIEDTNSLRFKDCGICAETLCEPCSYHVHDIGSHLITCDDCGIICPECSVFCGECDNQVCPKHSMRCSNGDCGGVLCKDARFFAVAKNHFAVANAIVRRAMCVVGRLAMIVSLCAKFAAILNGAQIVRFLEGKHPRKRCLSGMSMIARNALRVLTTCRNT